VGKRPLPWYAEEKRRRGAFAAFVGLHLACREGQSGWWMATAIGDSCLFQVRRHELLTAFPLTRPEDFTNRPHLLSTHVPPNGTDAHSFTALRNGGLLGAASEGAASLTRIEGGWTSGDRFYLMTDALGQWFLTCHLQGSQPERFLSPLLAGSNEHEFEAFVMAAREAGELRNDDVTLCALLVKGSHEP